MEAARNENALALNPLSRFTQRHLDLMRPELPVSSTSSASGFRTSTSQTISTITTESAQSVKDQKADITNSHEFKFFHKCPTEIQDLVWMLWLRDNGRIVHFGSQRNPPVLFRQIHSQLRNEYQPHGYVELKASRFGDDFATIIHVDFDILHFPPYSSVQAFCSQETRVTQAFRHSSAFERIRCIALPYTELSKMGPTLRKFINLELMIVTCGEASSGVGAGLFKEEKKCRRKWEVLSNESLLQGLLSTLRHSEDFLPSGLRLPSLSAIEADKIIGDQKQMLIDPWKSLTIEESRSRQVNIWDASVSDHGRGTPAVEVMMRVGIQGEAKIRIQLETPHFNETLNSSTAFKFQTSSEFTSLLRNYVKWHLVLNPMTKLANPQTLTKSHFRTDLSEPQRMFTKFKKLPTEIKDEIWRLFIETQPRVVQFATSNNPPILFRQINQELRTQYNLYGYLDFEHSQSGVTSTAIMHPDIDILEVPNRPGTSIEFNANLWSSLSSCDGLTKLRCVTFDLSHYKVAPPVLAKCESLELVIGTVWFCNPDCGYQKGQTEEKRHQWEPLGSFATAIVSFSSPVPTTSSHASEVEERRSMDFSDFPSIIQTAMSDGDAGKVVPHVVLLRKHDLEFWKAID
ncbi:hypothetical protein BDZ45DRAFT_694137 [Acephala macrosclerotiorum]|nr:hypothetical protein BDZ45DRAFT_694137 [Acephala macrosclerotiorum]